MKQILFQGGHLPIESLSLQLGPVSPCAGSVLRGFKEPCFVASPAFQAPSTFHPAPSS